MDNTKPTGESGAVETKTAPSAADQAPVATLLSSISYTSRDDYDKFVENLTNEHAILVLIAAANHCQSKGIFNLDEAALLAKSIKKITTKPTEPTGPQTGEGTSGKDAAIG